MSIQVIGNVFTTSENSVSRCKKYLVIKGKLFLFCDCFLFELFPNFALEKMIFFVTYSKQSCADEREAVAHTVGPVPGYQADA